MQALLLPYRWRGMSTGTGQRLAFAVTCTWSGYPAPAGHAIRTGQSVFPKGFAEYQQRFCSMMHGNCHSGRAIIRRVGCFPETDFAEKGVQS